ncbi:MAG: aspartyl-phosphate phosphatase Spo0E family protein [Firmicutes bacterium]|nr:aspartyl-phosphate phosphatase Spo0E family protein [Bacillota bacterium]
MAHEGTSLPCEEAWERVRTLQARLAALAEARGNLDPEVLAISQEIDRYIVIIQASYFSGPDWAASPSA